MDVFLVFLVIVNLCHIKPTEADECLPPNIPDHAKITAPTNGFPVDSSLEIECENGYQPKGKRYITCGKDKQWETPEECKDINECDLPSACGANEWCRNTPGSFKCPCLPGYIRGANASCIPIKCRGFGAINNNVSIDIEKDSYDYLDKVTFTCYPGYETYDQINTTILQCKPDGNWNEAVPKCKVRCPSKCDPRSDCSQSRDHACPHRKCKPGWWGRHCQHRRQCLPRDASNYFGTKNTTLSGISCDRWDMKGPKLRKYLQPPNDPSPENFCRHAGNYPYIWCYTSAATNSKSQWERCDIQSCDEQCEPPDINIFSFVKDPPLDGFTVGGIIIISCDDGYALSGSSTLTCLHNTSYYWSNSAPVCKVPGSLVSSSPAAAIGGVAAAVLLIILLVVFIVLIRRRKSNTIENCRPRNEGTCTYGNVPREDEAVNVYYEICPGNKPSENAVSTDNFKEYVTNKMKDIASLAMEFAALDSEAQDTSSAAFSPGNRSKNRNNSIYPYDKNRVKLAPWDGEAQSDYINASYINGAVKYRKYIAAQGPMESTVDDFWRMIWEQEVNCVVMLTNVIEDGEKICEQYWPNQKGSKRFRNVEVTLIEEYAVSRFTLRKMSLRKDDERRPVTQFHLMEWPDKGVPLLTSSLVNLRNKILKLPGVNSTPLLVHCSTGVGRTGTFIAFDYLLEQAETTGYIDVTKCVQILREQRMKMVETKEQYAFLHKVVSEALGHREKRQNSLTGREPYCDQTSKQDYDEKYQNLRIGPGNLLQHNSQHKGDKYQNLIAGHGGTPGQHSSTKIYQSIINRSHQSLEHIYNDLQFETRGNGTGIPENIGKNRSSSNVPGSCSGTGSIRAVYLASVTDQNAFITTQAPLQNSITDFWKLVYEQNVSSIVMLNDITVKSDGIYWPTSDVQVQFGSHSIRLAETTQTSFGEVSMLLLRANQLQEDRVVKQYRCTVWPDSSMIPTSTLPILDLISTAQNGVDEGPVIVHCMDGATKCGVYCTVAAAMQEMETEHKMDIPQIIKRFRQARPKIIRNLEQFRFCYDVMKEYCSMLDINQDSY